MEISTSSSICEVNALNVLVWGPSEPRAEIFEQWCQGFQFSESEPTALLQLNNGPCAVIAAVQAAILRQVIFKPEASFPVTTDLDNVELLSSGLLDIFKTIMQGSQQNIFTIYYWDASVFDDATSSNSSFLRFVTGIKSIQIDTLEELHALVLSLFPVFEAEFGLLCILYSVLQTHGLEGIRNGMLLETDTLIDSTFGSASQCLLNLLVTGQPTPYLFDGKRDLSGFSMQGTEAQPTTGFLTIMESLRYCEVGWFLKNPSTPIWILGSEGHFTVLASHNLDLVSVEAEAPNHPSLPNGPTPVKATLYQAEREFNTLCGSGDAGFLTYAQFEELLVKLGLPTDENSVNRAKDTIDADRLQIILRQPFLNYYYAEEIQRHSATVMEFPVLHFNGLATRNVDGKVVYNYGKARILDPVTDRSPLGSTSLDCCLRTKWPTIEVTWDPGCHPSID